MKRVWVFEYLSAGVADGGAAAADPADAELLAAGTSMRDALAADLRRMPGILVSVADQLDSQPGEDAVRRVAREAAQHDLAWVIAPETELLLARLNSVVAAPRWLGCSGAAITLTTSKRATSRRLAEHGVLTPLAFAEAAFGAGDAAPATQRWVVKPDDGAGAIATRVHASRATADADLTARVRSTSGPTSAAVLEPWVEGEALSLSLVCGGRRGEPSVELLSINRQQIAVDAAGSVAFHGVQTLAIRFDEARAAALQRVAQQVVAAIPGLRGFVGIDLVWHPPRGPVVIEVNPRLTAAYVGLSAALRRNLAAEIIDAHLMELADVEA